MTPTTSWVSTGYSPEFASLMPAVAAVEKIFMSKTAGVPFDSDSIQEAVVMFVLAQAIEKAGTLDPETVAKTLRAGTWESPLSLGGKVAFAPGGQNIKAESVVTQLQGGQYKRIFPEGLADTKIDLPHEALEPAVADTPDPAAGLAPAAGCSHLPVDPFRVLAFGVSYLVFG